VFRPHGTCSDFPAAPSAEALGFFLRPFGAFSFSILATHSLRCGLHSFAASRLNSSANVSRFRSRSAMHRLSLPRYESEIQGASGR
jgi:hypothetical protein